MHPLGLRKLVGMLVVELLGLLVGSGHVLQRSVDRRARQGLVPEGLHRRLELRRLIQLLLRPLEGEEVHGDELVQHGPAALRVVVHHGALGAHHPNDLVDILLPDLPVRDLRKDLLRVGLRSVLRLRLRLRGPRQARPHQNHQSQSQRRLLREKSLHVLFLLERFLLAASFPGFHGDMSLIVHTTWHCNISPTHGNGVKVRISPSAPPRSPISRAVSYNA